MGRSILLTRPIKQSKIFEKMLLKQGVKDPIVIAPMVTIVIRKFSGDELKKIKAFIVTSSNAIEAIKKNKSFSLRLSREHIPIYCVGKHTTEIARNYGFNSSFFGSTVSDLADNLGKKLFTKTAHLKPEEICYLRGRKITLNLAKYLGLKEKIVYSQIENDIDPKIEGKITSGVIGDIFFFSSHTVDLFFDKINGIEASINIFCLSENIRNKVIDRIGREKDNVYFTERPISLDMVNLFLSKKQSTS